MIETIHHMTCDGCGLKDIPGTQTVSIPVDRRSDGNGKDTVYRELELCPNCLRVSLLLVVERIPMTKRMATFPSLEEWREVLK